MNSQKVNPMKRTNSSIFSRLMAGEAGQALPWIAGIMSAFMAVGGGLAVDLGRAYIIRSDMQNYANAMALAAAGSVYNSSSANSAATEASDYSASKGDENYNPGLNTVTPTVTEVCLNTLMPSGETCGTTTPANAVKVSESTSITTYFMKLFGVPSLTVTADATASMQGQAQPWNVAIILDATDSMVSTTDSNCSTGTNVTEFTCALQSIQTLLKAVNPCGPGVTSCNTSNADFHVALFAFPNVETSERADDYGCNGTIPTPEPYTLPSIGLSSYTPLTYNGVNATYEVTLPNTGNADANGFVSDYYDPSSSNGLNPDSEIVKALGAVSGCSAMNTQGGESTYYAGVLYAAQAAVTAEQALYPGSKNAIIMLSDGQANAASSKFPPSGSSPTPAADGIAIVTNLISNLLGNLTGSTFGYYPDFHDECQQAIMAGQYATKEGTRVYAMAYGSESDGCGVAGSGATVSDTTTIATGANQSFTAATLTPCITMENIASSLNYFYSDWDQSGSGSTCVDNSHTTTSLADISLAIAASLTEPRLLPNNAK
jgi:hypothetical protein